MDRVWIGNNRDGSNEGNILMIEYKLSYTLLRFKVFPEGTRLDFNRRFKSLDESIERKQLYQKFITGQTRKDEKIESISEEEDKYFAGDYKVLSVGDITKIETTIIG